ncbi:MAG TPA: hypothetical protein VMT24_04290 [Aggregatilineaceae bacterium]|nr:hypothetical protein [Aggregatilineaceae bacterium]
MCDRQRGRREQLAALLGEGTEEVKLAIDRLADHLNVTSTHAVRATAVNNGIETLYASSPLPKNPKTWTT